MNEQRSPEKILQTGLAFWASKTLLSAIEMGLFTELARRPRAVRYPQRAARPAPALGARLPRRAGGARLPAARTAIATPTRPRPTSSSIGTSPPTWAACSRWRTTACIRSGVTSRRRFAPARRRTSSRTGGPGLFETLYADPARLKQFLAAMTGISHGANMTIARVFPWKDYRTFVDVGTAQGDLAAQIALANPHLQGRRVRPAGSGADLRGVRRDGRRRRPAHVHAGRLLQARPPQGRRRADGAHPARLGSADEEDADRKAFDAVPAGGALIVYEVDHRRRPVEERVWVDDEPEHADRDAGRLRLHRRRLRGLDEGGRILATRVEPLVGPDSMVVGIK